MYNHKRGYMSAITSHDMSSRLGDSTRGGVGRRHLAAERGAASFVADVDVVVVFDVTPPPPPSDATLLESESMRTRWFDERHLADSAFGFGFTFGLLCCAGGGGIHTCTLWAAAVGVTSRVGVRADEHVIMVTSRGGT